MLKPYQFRFYGDNNPNNYPLELTAESLANGNFLSLLPDTINYNSCITQLGLQSVPGVQFKINNGKNWIEIPNTGIYELDFLKKGFIENINFNITNKYWQTNFGDQKEFFLFIDVLYQGV